MDAIKRGFTPEFRNRLDAIIQFKSLAPRQIANVVDKLLLELEQQLEEKKVRLVVDDEVRQWLGREGYDEILGARPMARLIQERIKRPLAEELLFGALAEHGGTVRFSLDESGDPTLSIQPAEEALTEESPG
jgi:ATP-dependent Clp protease ATP-binding subunit ClpA